VEATDLLLASLAIGVGALVQGTLGFGQALVAAPLLVLISPSLVPAPLLVLAIALNVLIGWRERAYLDLRGLRWPLAGQVAGTVVAIGMLEVSSQRTISLVLAASVLLAVGLSALGLRLDPTRRNLGLAGTLAGFMGTTSSMPGPPLALVHQHVPGHRLRATMVPFFIMGATFSIIGLTASGRMGFHDVEMGLLLVPAMAVGFGLSRWTIEWVSPELLRRCVLALSALAAVFLIQQSL
jgi:uncharacterized membrane protein YfcA